MSYLSHGQAAKVTLPAFHITEILSEEENKCGEMELSEAIPCHHQGTVLIINRNAPFRVFVVCQIRACLMVIDTKSPNSVLQSAFKNPESLGC